MCVIVSLSIKKVQFLKLYGLGSSYEWSSVTSEVVNV